MTTQAEKAHDKADAKAEAKSSKKADAAILEAIRGRLTARRADIFGHSVVGGPYTTQDLGDAEWLLVELDKALGHPDALTPAESWELAQLTKKRKLDSVEQGVWDRLSYRTDKLSGDDLVMKDHLCAKLDACLTAEELKRYKELSAQAEKYSEK